MKHKIKSYAKLNLYLKVLNQRKDKFHNIITVFERIDLADDITLIARSDNKIRLKCNIPKLPTDENNLAYKAAKLLQDSLRVKKGVDISLIKHIPVSAGLGGGSSNAAVIIKGLNRLWGLRLSQEKLANLGRKIGADVPFFIYDCRFAYGTGRGDRIKPLAFKNIKLWHILVVPQVKVSTPLIYQKWDELRLTIPKDNAKINYFTLKKQGLPLLKNILLNNLEPVTSKLCPQIKIIKETLSNLGVKSILMSGSGPAVLGIVSSKKEAVSLCEQLGKTNRTWQTFVTTTY